MSRFIAPFRHFFLRATDAPPEYGEAAALMALSSIALGRRWLDYGSGIRPNLFMMIVGESSVARKSTTVNFAKRIVEEVEPDRVGPRDYTMEALMKWMNEVPPGASKGTKLRRNRVGLFAEEFGADLARMDAYASTMATDFCALYDGESFTKVRVTSGTTTIVKPRVSLFAAAAYQMIVRYLDAQDWLNGFLMRFLFVAPLTMRPKLHIPPPWPKADWDAAVSGLTNLSDDLKRSAFGVSIDQSALFEYINVSQQLDQLASSLTNIAQTYCARFMTSLLKVALLYQIDIDADQPISDAAMQQAVSFCVNVCWPSFHVAHERTCLTEFSAMFEQLRTMIAQCGGSIPLRDLGHHYAGNRRVMEVVDYMTSVGMARRVKKTTPGFVGVREFIELT